MAQYSLLVLKVPLNTNQATSCAINGLKTFLTLRIMGLSISVVRHSTVWVRPRPWNVSLNKIWEWSAVICRGRVRTCSWLETKDCSYCSNCKMKWKDSLLFHAGQAAIKLPSAEASKRAQCTSPGLYAPYIKWIMKTPLSWIPVKEIITSQELDIIPRSRRQKRRAISSWKRAKNKSKRLYPCYIKE